MVVALFAKQHIWQTIINAIKKFEPINHNNLNAFMKIIFLFIMLQIAVFNALAQKLDSVNLRRPEPVNTMKDKQEYQGYSIRLLPAMPMPGGMVSYGFDILKDNKVVVHQVQNALFFSAKGIQKKRMLIKLRKR